MADAKHRGFLDPKAPPSDSGSNPAQRIEDDPLVELARIVSESAANLSRLGAQPGEEPTLILGRATPRPVPVRGDAQPSPGMPANLAGAQPPSAPVRPIPQPVATVPPRAPVHPAPVHQAPVFPTPAPAAADDRKSPRISEDDLMASLRQSIEPGRGSAEAARSISPKPEDDDDAPTVSLHLRGGPAAAPAGANAQPAPKPPAVSLEESFDDLLFDISDKIEAGKPNAASEAEPKAERPRLGDNFPRPAMDPQAKGGRTGAAPADSRPRVTPPTQPRGKVRAKSSEGSGRGLFFAGSALAVVVLAGLGFLGYRAFAPVIDPSAVPVIKAAGKVKEEPAKPQVAAVDSGATKLSADRVEDKSNLITKSEEPVEQVSLAPRKIAPGAPGTVVPQPPSATDQPRTVKTVVVRPDGSIIQQAAAPAQVPVKTQPIQPAEAAPAPLPAAAPPADPAPAKDPVGQLAALPPAPAALAPLKDTAPAPQPSIAAKTVLPQNNGAGGAVAPKLAPQPAPVKIGQPAGAPLALAPQAQPPQALQAQPRVALANPPPVPVAPVPVAPVAQTGSGGDFMVQLSAQDSEDAARKAFAAAQAKHGALAGRSPDVQRATVNGRTVFRVRVAAGSQEQAAGLCSQIKSTGGDCFVAKR